jgi:hypothetical protein
MPIETIAILGVVFAAANLAAIAYKRRMDVLYGPYIEGRAAARSGISVERGWNPVHSAASALEGPQRRPPCLDHRLLIRGRQ